MSTKKIDLDRTIDRCKKGDRISQKKLYEHFYGYTMSIALRYAADETEAQEIVNDAFFKILTQIHSYESSYPFKVWLRRILVNTCIDSFRKRTRIPQHMCLEELIYEPVDEAIVSQLISDEEDVLPILLKLPPAYRIVFNLYIMEGYQHNEIAEMLGISVSTSRSNLVRAKEKLYKILVEKYPDRINKIIHT